MAVILRGMAIVRHQKVSVFSSFQLGVPVPHGRQDALGHLTSTGINGRGGPIVGVIRDFHSASLQDPITPFFIGTETDWENSVSVRLAPGARNPEAVHTMLGKAEKIWREIYPNETFKYHFFDDEIAGFYSRERHLSGLLSLAMGIAIAISCMGLLGLASFAAQRRRKEMSIRRVLGASAGRIVALLTGTFLWPVALAFVIATPVAWYFMHQWLQGFAYQTTAPWWVYAACGTGAVVIALLTVGWQAVRTATANPAENLKTE